MDGLIARAKKPYLAKTEPLPVPNDVYNQILAPEFSQSRWLFARDEAANSFVLVSLALHAYRLENKRYPENLSQLVPKYLKKVPTDA